MANDNDQKSLEERALEILKERHEGENLVIASPAQGVVLSSKANLFQFSAVKQDDPNGPHYTVVLDGTGAEVDLASLSEGVDFLTVPKLAGSTVLVGPLPTLPAPITIDPTVNDLVLNADDTFSETITVTVPPNFVIHDVDVYFLADTTGSMGSVLSTVQAGLGSIINALNSLSTTLGINIACGVGNYKDFPNPSSAPYAFQHQLSPTTNFGSLPPAINSWSASGGSDLCEGQLFALDQLAEPPGGPIGWHSGAKRILVWIGDAPGHDPICNAISSVGYNITEASATAKLVAQNITVLAISTITDTITFPLGLDDDPTKSVFDYVNTCPIGGTPSQATRITAATGGVHQTTTDLTTLVPTIINLVITAATTINNLNLVPTGGTAPFVTSISPAGGYGPLSGSSGHVLRFDVTFTGVVPCARTAQVFTGTLDVVADGVVEAQKQVKVTVPPCRYSYSVKFVCGVQKEDDEHDCLVVRPGAYATEINIHNFKNTPAEIEKYVLPVVIEGVPFGREPKWVERRGKDSIVLPPNTATMDDCCRIRQITDVSPSSTRLMVGFLEIVSSHELNVSVVYTVGDLKSESVSIEVEQIEGKIK